MLLEASPADEAASQGDEGVVEFGAAFPADGQPLELVEQGEGLLYDVAKLAQSLIVRCALAGYHRQDRCRERIVNDPLCVDVCL
ncbi:hypothetical protein [Streptomyces sp. NPDC088246]|uniref:hypothetical protein n=1 Tax=Streptomyces sp. NPDC088246 TaxID=3365842 RepID=UPI003823C0AA